MMMNWDQLPQDVLTTIFDYATAVAVMRCTAVCHTWREMAIAERAWQPRLSTLQQGKQCRMPQDVAQLHGRFRFFGMLHESRRTWVTEEEIMELEWSFRFKSAAGDGWIDRDPWWNGQEPIMLKLREDHKVQALNDARPFWGVQGQIAGQWHFEPGSAACHEPSVVTMNGHPSYVVRRHPAHWGVFMESCWCVWTGFPMAPSGRDPWMEDRALKVSADDPRQRQEVQAYNMRVRR